jgi:hypothetical protein
MESKGYYVVGETVKHKKVVTLKARVSPDETAVFLARELLEKAVVSSITKNQTTSTIILIIFQMMLALVARMIMSIVSMTRVVGDPLYVQAEHLSTIAKSKRYNLIKLPGLVRASTERVIWRRPVPQTAIHLQQTSSPVSQSSAQPCLTLDKPQQVYSTLLQ